MTRSSLVCLTCVLVAAAACSDDQPTFVDAARDAGTDAAPLGMLPSSIDIGLGDCGASASRQFSVMNTGGSDLTYSLAVSDTNTFAVAPATGTVLAGTATTFTLTAVVPTSATAATPLTGTLTATTNLPVPTVTIPISVTPRGAHIVINPASIGFGQGVIGTPISRTFSVMNTGNGDAVVTIAAPGGEFTRTFGTAGSANVGALASASGTFLYTPSNLGVDSGSAALTITGVTCGTQPTAIGLSGEGTTSGGVLVQGTPVDFGTVDCGSASATATVTLMNTAQIDAPFTASFPTDPQGDDARYTVTPASGTVAAGSSTTLTITRLNVGLPATPRAYDAVLRIVTTLGSATTTDVPVRQTLRGAVLSATPTTRDFGFAPVGVSQTASISLTNSGTASATLSNDAAAPFAMSLPAMLPGGVGGVGSTAYAPAVTGPVNATVHITAPGACSLPVNVNLTAGDGPYASITPGSVSGDCPLVATDTVSGSLSVANLGTQTLTIGCVEQGTSGTNPAFTPTTLSVGAGSSAAFTVDMAAGAGSAVHSGDTTANLLCTDNEVLSNTRTTSVARHITGADYVLSAPAPLDFTCFQPDSKTWSTRNDGNVANAPFPLFDLTYPLSGQFTFGTIAPGQEVSHAVVAYGSGAGTNQAFGVPADACSGSGAPGSIAFQGSVSIQDIGIAVRGLYGTTGSICSITPANLTVTIRYPNN